MTDYDRNKLDGEQRAWVIVAFLAAVLILSASVLGLLNTRHNDTLTSHRRVIEAKVCVHSRDVTACLNQVENPDGR